MNVYSSNAIELCVKIHQEAIVLVRAHFIYAYMFVLLCTCLSLIVLDSWVLILTRLCVNKVTINGI